MHCPVALRLLPVAVALIVLSTAVPLEFRAPLWEHAEPSILDFVANVLLYTLLGLTLWRCPLSFVLLLAVAISAPIEGLQIWSIARHASVLDILANACGAATGALVAKKLVTASSIQFDTIRIGPPATGVAVIVAVLAALSTIPVFPSNLSDWEPEFELLLGNEQTSDRPWRGEILSLALFADHLSVDEVRRIGGLEDLDSEAASNPDTFVLPGPITLKGDAGLGIPKGLSERFARLAMQNDAFSVVARITTADIRQKGPARIVSFSRDQFNRNFDLGQQGRALVFRVRTPTAGPNGNDPRVEAAQALMPQRSVTVAATYNGAVARIYVDDRLQARSNLAAAGCAVAALCNTGLPLNRALFGAALAVIALVLARRHGRRRSIVGCLLLVVVGTGVLRLIHLALDAEVLELWTDIIPPVAAMWIAGALTNSSIGGDSRWHITADI